MDLLGVKPAALSGRPARVIAVSIKSTRSGLIFVVFLACQYFFDFFHSIDTIQTWSVRPKSRQHSL